MKEWCDECQKETTRYGGPGTSCRSCASRKTATAIWAKRTPEQRRKFFLKRAVLTPEERSEIARKREARKTPEVRSASARNGGLAVQAHLRAHLTPEQRREMGRKRGLARVAKHGPLIMIGEEHPMWKGDEAGSDAIHKRVWSAFGAAANFPCIECEAEREAGARGEDAMYWSYDGYCPTERKGGEDGPYTTDLSGATKTYPSGAVVWLPAWYSPRCAICHFKYDYLHGLRRGWTPQEGAHDDISRGAMVEHRTDSPCSKVPEGAGRNGSLLPL